uniref:Uncharacterized protein n=1 Tax=Alexandrium andersonii TaxID=327968 RepID=A0A7S2AN82_9DINO|mmetsp:Transcript_15476/g.34923  ORF Transcript_15476/g.34923 Transcript_15476/m.34923 type:complete len:150 (+) Transcript_15476:76-525(+)
MVRPMCRTHDDYLAEALCMDAEDFLTYFGKVNPQVQKRYTDLCRQNNTLDDFLASPLVFILANRPKCCTYVATGYIDCRCGVDSRGPSQADKSVVAAEEQRKHFGRRPVPAKEAGRLRAWTRGVLQRAKGEQAVRGTVAGRRPAWLRFC